MYLSRGVSTTDLTDSVMAYQLGQLVCIVSKSQSKPLENTRGQKIILSIANNNDILLFCLLIVVGFNILFYLFTWTDMGLSSLSTPTYIM